MPSLSDLISNAKSQIKQNTGTQKNQLKATTRGQLNQASQNTKNVVPNAVSKITTPITSGVSSVISKGVSGVSQAAGQLMTGDVTGASESLSNTVRGSMSSLAKVFGLNQGATLTSPGSSEIVAGNSLAGALARADPVLSFSWYALMPDITAINSAPRGLPWYYVEEATPPFRTFETRSIFKNGKNKHYPSTYSVDTLRLAIYADVANVALDYLNAWNSAILAPIKSVNADTRSGGYGRPQGFKRNIQIYLISADKQTVAVMEYVGCWPVSMEAYPLDSNSSGRIINQVTFSVDDVFLTYVKGKASIPEPAAAPAAKPFANQRVIFGDD